MFLLNIYCYFIVLLLNKLILNNNYYKLKFLLIKIFTLKSGPKSHIRVRSVGKGTPPSDCGLARLWTPSGSPPCGPLTVISGPKTRTSTFFFGPHFESEVDRMWTRPIRRALPQPTWSTLDPHVDLRHVCHFSRFFHPSSTCRGCCLSSFFVYIE